MKVGQKVRELDIYLIPTRKYETEINDSDVALARVYFHIYSFNPKRNNNNNR